MVSITEKEFDELNKLSRVIVDSIYQVHKIMGPGLLERVYQKCLCVELSKRGLNNKEEVEIPLTYKDININANYRIDILVENKIILELKSVEKILPIHEAQLLTYLKLSNNKLGFLVNFNVKYIKEGLKRMVN